MLRFIPVVLVSLLLFCSGCSFVVMSAYGIKNPKKLNQIQIASQARKYTIPAESSFELDTAFYFSYLKSMNTVQYREQVKNHYQPLQALYFNKQGQLQNFHINCFAGGFPNLEWNRNGTFDSFPPKMQAPVDSLVSFQILTQYLKPLSSAKPIQEISEDYLVVVFWSRFMGRQSKRLIETVQQNCFLANQEKVKIIFVNNDNLMATQ